METSEHSRGVGGHRIGSEGGWEGAQGVTWSHPLFQAGPAPSLSPRAGSAPSPGTASAPRPGRDPVRAPALGLPRARPTWAPARRLRSSCPAGSPSPRPARGTRVSAPPSPWEAPAPQGFCLHAAGREGTGPGRELLSVCGNPGLIALVLLRQESSPCHGPVALAKLARDPARVRGPRERHTPVRQEVPEMGRPGGGGSLP